MNKFLKELIKIIAILAITVPAFAFLAGTWTEPGVNPPGGNVDAPINVGSSNQVKTGNISAGALVSKGTALLAKDWGKVGIGTINPLQTLQLDSLKGEEVGIRLHQNGIRWWEWKIKPNNGALYLTDVSANQDRVIIDTTGKMGVGTMSPKQTIDAAGYVRGSSGLCIGNDCRTSWPSGGGGGHGDGANCPAGQVAAGVDANGNVQGCIVPTGTLGCTSVNKTGVFGSIVIASCPASYSVTGGGCANGSGSQPSGNGWSCSGQDGVSKTAFAQCCRIE